MRKYLISKSIGRNRLRSTGYGVDRLIVNRERSDEDYAKS